MSKAEFKELMNEVVDLFMLDHDDSCFEQLDRNKIFVETCEFLGDNRVFKHEDRRGKLEGS